MIYDIAIIGAGVAGAAIAYELAGFNLKTCLLEKGNQVCSGATKANSGIVHAGYDPSYGSLIAKLNVAGSELMPSLCKKLCVRYQQTSSFVAGYDEKDEKTLQKLYENGLKNGVPQLFLLNGDQAKAIEPNLSPLVKQVLWAKTAAIVDPIGLCLALCEVAVKNSVTLHCNAEVSDIKSQEGIFFIHLKNTGIIKARYIINAAGAYADEVHQLAGGSGFHLETRRGEYDILDKSMGKFSSCILFQCPDEQGKGVLVTPTVHGNLLIGPNNKKAVKEDVSTTAQGIAEVRKMALRLCPTLTFSESIRQFAGLRTFTVEGDDFIIAPSPQVPRFINVAGIKSPGLSAAPAIAKKVVGLLDGMKVPLSINKAFEGTRHQIHFASLSTKEKQQCIANNPQYGHVVCRCQQITEAEIAEAIHSPLQLKTIDGIKAYCTAGMGRCQGGFCGPKIIQIIARELKIPPHEVMQGSQGSYILIPEEKSHGH